MIKDKQNKITGFTIVELLITIVIIAVLATISIIAYRGIQQRAKTAAVNATVSESIKAFRLAEDFGAIIDASDGFACMGRSANDFPAADGFAAGECMQTPDWSAAYRDNAFVNWPSDIMRPNGKLPVTTFTDGDGVTYRARGIVIAPYVGLIWIPQIAGECGVGQRAGDTPINENNALLGDACVWM